MRLVERDGRAVDDSFVEAMDTCVQCRGCETACPSAVPFGRLMEQTRASLASQGRARPPGWLRLGLRALPHRRLVLAGSSALGVAQRMRLVPARAGLPARLPVRQRRVRPTGDDVWLFTGCVMDAWQRDVHRAVVDVLGAMGVGVAFPHHVRRGGCCGALHVHAGLQGEARRLARRVVDSMPGEAPVLVDSAGCGAALCDYGHLLGAEGAAFAARVRDVHAWLAEERIDELPPPQRPAVGGAAVAVQDPCHLRHVQRAHAHVRTVLRPYVSEIEELDDEGLCCGAGGAFAMVHPEDAAAIRERKLRAIARTGAAVVASANPGCAIHLAAAGLEVRHPMQLIAESAGEP